MHKLIEQHKTQIRQFARQRDIRNVRVFGSMCQDDATPDSDVDLLVELEAGRSGLALGVFLLDVAELLERRVDIVTEQALHPRIKAAGVTRGRAVMTVSEASI